ncbi:MAG: hypothetical protein JXC32_11100, partial [Anaerolineae bacterium]|nr:hypothetical protein [Anaerolineae bacterium]
MRAYDTQFLEIGQLLSLHAGNLRDSLERIWAELNFADQLSRARPEEATAWQSLIVEAAQGLDDGLRAGRCNIETLTAQAEAVLAPLSAAAKEYTLLCVGHAHIDMNWQWSWPETVALTHDTFQTMLALMDEFPAFIFSQSQGAVYAAIEKYNPAMFARIRERVGEGRWEVMASQWVEGDKNMA